MQRCDRYPAADEPERRQQQVVAERKHDDRHDDRRQNQPGYQVAAGEKPPVHGDRGRAAGKSADRHGECRDLERNQGRADPIGVAEIVGEGMDRDPDRRKLDEVALGQRHRHDDQRRHDEQHQDRRASDKQQAASETPAGPRGGEVRRRHTGLRGGGSAARRSAALPPPGSGPPTPSPHRSRRARGRNS